MRGATDSVQRTTAGDAYFNPRTPCGVRLIVSSNAVFCVNCISIHAPHAGCDLGHIPPLWCLRYFNPRTPCGVRPVAFPPSQSDSGFQSTHPMRGATELHSHKDAQGIFQSTHPMRGATSVLAAAVRNLPNFNPRTPCGVRPHISVKWYKRAMISIHAPHAGCDVTWCVKLPIIFSISIHAPHAGCDLPVVFFCRHSG